MQYKSTRDANNVLTASQAILQGLAGDGGLYVPTEFPQFDLDWQKLKDFTYQEMAYFILSAYLDDFTSEQIQACINAAYDDKFDDPTIAPLVKVGDHYHLELFHGATLAFKDMALSILPHLLRTSAEINKNDHEIIILTATSGDTGKAAMEGFSNVEGTKIIVFYPKGGVSSIQERQMLTQEGDNTYVISIVGNFDDAQTEVKRLFKDQALCEELAENGTQFSSANSMNIGRLVPQIVYYFFAYAQLLKMEAIEAGDRINVSVPTGNFGNILAAYYAKQSGLPIHKLICASNDNKVLYDFFKSMSYDKNRDFILTSSPSMDILVSSNFERLIYHAVNEDTDELVRLMNGLEEEGKYTILEKYRSSFEDFIGQYASEEEVAQEIRNCYEKNKTLIDTHTAVASKALAKAEEAGLSGDASLVVSTASPFKFPLAVLEAIGVETEGKNDQEILKCLEEKVSGKIPAAMQGLLQADILHDCTIEVSKMRAVVQDIAKK